MSNILELEAAGIQRLCELLNQQINTSGQIQRSNKAIWAVLHQMDNEIWNHILNGAEAITPPNHRYANRIDQRTVELRGAIDRLGKLYPNVITPYPQEFKREKRKDGDLYQNAAWHLLMMMRDVYCDLNGINLPNADSSKGLLGENNI